MTLSGRLYWLGVGVNIVTLGVTAIVSDLPTMLFAAWAGVTFIVGYVLGQLEDE